MHSFDMAESRSPAWVIVLTQGPFVLREGMYHSGDNNERGRNWKPSEGQRHLKDTVWTV